MRETSSPPRPDAIEVSSVLAADAARVWSEAIRFEGINDELMPLLRMTSPRRWRDRSLDDVRRGERLFRSWLLLLGVLPIDYDDIRSAEFWPGHRFLERSRMLSALVWEHERTVTDEAPHGCRVTDRVRFTARFKALRPVLRFVVPRVFAHRHRRLTRRYRAPSDL